MQRVFTQDGLNFYWSRCPLCFFFCKQSHVWSWSWIFMVSPSRDCHKCKHRCFIVCCCIFVYWFITLFYTGIVSILLFTCLSSLLFLFLQLLFISISILLTILIRNCFNPFHNGYDIEMTVSGCITVVSNGVCRIDTYVNHLTVCSDCSWDCC